MRIGVFLSVPYEGGSLRLAKIYAKMLMRYGKENCVDLKVVFSNTEGSYNVERDLQDLVDEGIEIRHFEWKFFNSSEAVEYSDFLKIPCGRLNMQDTTYCVPYDRSSGYLDCDFWLFMVDRIPGVVLPFRPFGIFATDFIQRYIPDIFPTECYEGKNSFLLNIFRNFRNAHATYACTPKTVEDLKDYVGRFGSITELEPVLDDSFLDLKKESLKKEGEDYFVWVTNGTIHKNHERALSSLVKYYTQHGGRLKCVVTGVQTASFDPNLESSFKNNMHPYLRRVNEIISGESVLRDNIKIMGNIPDARYRDILAGAKFLWHNVLVDNGTFSVIEAAKLGVRSLSSRYPQQEYIDQHFDLGMEFFDPYNIADAALKLKLMEKEGWLQKPRTEQIDQYVWSAAYKTIGPVLMKSINDAIELKNSPGFFS